MSERVGKYTGIEDEKINGLWVLFRDGYHCRPEIRADAKANFQITGEEYLPWDIIRCSCGRFWVLGGNNFEIWRPPFYELIPISKRRVRQKLLLTV